MKIYIDKTGKNYSFAEMRHVLEKAVGSAFAADYLHVGQVYRNGGIWFQRVA